jgi:hypothetical protein
VIVLLLAEVDAAAGSIADRPEGSRVAGIGAPNTVPLAVAEAGAPSA